MSTMEFDIVIQLTDEQPAGMVKCKAFDSVTAAAQIKAESFEKALQILNENKQELYSAMEICPPQGKATTSADIDAEIKEDLNTEKGRQMIKAFRTARDLSKKHKSALSSREIAFLIWKICRGSFSAALSDAYNLGFKRGYNKKTTARRKTA